MDSSWQNPIALAMKYLLVVFNFDSTYNFQALPREDVRFVRDVKLCSLLFRLFLKATGGLKINIGNIGHYAEGIKGVLLAGEVRW